MSGHSHAKTVMGTKMANAAKKGKIFSKYGRLITIAVKDGGGSGDPSKNSKLKAIMEQAKKMDMPKKNIENLEMIAIEAGSDDIKLENDILIIYTKPEDLELVKKSLEEKNIKIDSASLNLVAKEEVTVSDKESQQCQKLFDVLDDNDAVQDVYSNLKN